MTDVRQNDPLETAEAVKLAIGEGDLCKAYDLAASAISSADASDELRYLQVLSLARMGARPEAWRLYNAYELDKLADTGAAALPARLLKDEAFELPLAERGPALCRAAKAYEAVFEGGHDPFPGVNAATLWLLAGEQDRACKLAERVLSGIGDPETYYDAVTLTEAHLVCGRVEEAATNAAIAGQLCGGDAGAVSTTRRQLWRILNFMEASEAVCDQVLAPLSPGQVVFFCGHIFAEGDGDEAALAARIDAELNKRNVTVGYGALAAGADILVAEALIRRGAELNVVLPFRKSDFIAQSVDRPGRWVERFEACMDKAKVVRVTNSPFVDDPWQFSFGSAVAMGLARLRARHLWTDVFQLAVWDGVSDPQAKAGTGADVNAWRATGGETEVIAFERKNRKSEVAAPTVSGWAGRTLKAYIFGDFSGFSKLSEDVLPVFWEEVMGRIARVVRGHGEQIMSSNTWGDGLFLVVSDAPSAAAIALDIQSELAKADLSALNLPGEVGMRLGVHYGPAYEGEDPVTGLPAYYGSQISLAARIEPRVAPGEVYVSQTFAAILASEAPDTFGCAYIGQVELPKGHGRLPLHRLRRRN